MNVKALVVSVEEYIQRRLPNYVDELRTLCAIDSFSYYKPGLDEMIRVVEARMRRLGMETRIFQQEQWGNDVLGILRGTGSANVAIVGHVDTVYPPGVAAMRPLRIEKNTIYGPGVSDMKGCVLAALYAIEALQAQGCHSFGELRFLCVSDEEICDRHSEGLIRQVVQDCQAALILEAAGADGSIISARKGTARYKMRASGHSAHAGVEPEKGRNAVVELAHQIVQLQSLNGWRDGLTLNACLVAGGTAENAIPDSAEVSLDMRFLRHQDGYDTENRLREMMQHHLIEDVELTLELLPSHYRPMVHTPESERLIALAQEIAQHIDITLQHTLRGGGSDGCNTSALGVPTLDGLGPIGGLDHSPDEYLLLDSVPSRTALLAGLIACIEDSIGQKEAVHDQGIRPLDAFVHLDRDAVACDTLDRVESPKTPC